MGGSFMSYGDYHLKMLFMALLIYSVILSSP